MGCSVILRRTREIRRARLVEYCICYLVVARVRLTLQIVVAIVIKSVDMSRDATIKADRVNIISTPSLCPAPAFGLEDGVENAVVARGGYSYRRSVARWTFFVVEVTLRRRR